MHIVECETAEGEMKERHLLVRIGISHAEGHLAKSSSATIYVAYMARLNTLATLCLLRLLDFAS
jgi:hypothetical protein